MNNPLHSKLDKTIERLQKGKEVYGKICAYAQQVCLPVVNLIDTPLFEEALQVLGPALPLEKVTVDLKEIYDVAFHTKSCALIIANKGASIVALSPFSSINYITRHIACSVYHPNLGLESVNIGLVGNVYDKEVILRAESACPPAFLFGSQRCNCCYQWASIRELAAHFNPVEVPKGLSEEKLEEWVESQFNYVDGKHLPQKEGQGVILIYMDSQAGMGSGFSEGEFTLDLYNRALMRQLGENRVEQVYHTSLKQSYASLGVAPDSRREAQEAGYSIAAIVLEWLCVNQNIIILSNNKFKIKQLESHGFNVRRVKSLGKIDSAGKREALQRGKDFEHLDMDGEELTFDQELVRLKSELSIL